MEGNLHAYFKVKEAHLEKAASCAIQPDVLGKENYGDIKRDEQFPKAGGKGGGRGRGGRSLGLTASYYFTETVSGVLYDASVADMSLPNRQARRVHTIKWTVTWERGPVDAAGEGEGVEGLRDWPCHIHPCVK